MVSAVDLVNLVFLFIICDIAISKSDASVRFGKVLSVYPATTDDADGPYLEDVGNQETLIHNSLKSPKRRLYQGCIKRYSNPLHRFRGEIHHVHWTDCTMKIIMKYFDRDQILKISQANSLFKGVIDGTQMTGRCARVGYQRMYGFKTILKRWCLNICSRALNRINIPVEKINNGPAFPTQDRVRRSANPYFYMIFRICIKPCIKRTTGNNKIQRCLVQCLKLGRM